MQTNDIYNTCLDISNVLNAGDISNARSKVITLLHEINGTNNNSYMKQEDEFAENSLINIK